ncbi:hypothetical protein D9M68_632610 [compost metagenome]
MAQDAIAGTRTILQFDSAVAPFEHFDVDDTALDFLARKVGSGQHEALFLVVGPDAPSRAVQLGEVQVASLQVVEQGQQPRRVEQVVAAQAEALDPDPRTFLVRRTGRGFLRRGLCRLRFGGRGKTQALAGDVAHDLSCVGYLSGGRQGQQQ